MDTQQPAAKGLFVNQNQRWVVGGLIAGGLVAAYVLAKLLGGIWSALHLGGASVPSIVAVVFGAALVLWLLRQERVTTVANEIVAELKKVQWPTVKDTQRSTIVVIIVVIIISLLLGMFDLIWAKLSDLIYRQS